MAPAVASASPSAKLVYVRGEGAQACPAEADVRQAVVARLGYDPFFPIASKTVLLQIRRDDALHAYRGALQIVGDDGNLQGSRDLVSRGDDCAELVRTMALAVSLAVDDLDETPSSDTPSARAPSPPVEATEKKKPSSPPPSDRDRAPSPLRFDLSAGPTVSFGTAPSAALGASGAITLRYGRVGARLDLRGELPSSTSFAPNGLVSTNTATAILAGCIYPSAPFVCLGGGAGWIWSRTDRIQQPSSDDTPLALLLARVGVDVPLGRMLYLEPLLEGTFHLTRPHVQVDGSDVFQTYLFAGTLGVHVGGHFF